MRMPTETVLTSCACAQALRFTPFGNGMRNCVGASPPSVPAAAPHTHLVRLLCINAPKLFGAAFAGRHW